jgi:hypothetical protein
MCRRAGLLAVVALAALILYPSPAQEEVRAPQTGVPTAALRSVPSPSVTLQHQLIQIEPLRRQKPAPRMRRTLPPTRLAYATLTRPGTIAARARRVVLGDGRFRPEPFPHLER